MATINSLNNASAPFTVTSGDLTASSGNLLLPTTSSTVGQIKINSISALHTFGAENIFLSSSGNFTMTGVGRNTIIGALSLTSATTGNSNTSCGYHSLPSTTNGYLNSCYGYESCLAYTSSEHSNIIIGSPGTLGDSHKIRIGVYGTSDGQQDSAYIAGIVYGSNGLVASSGNIVATSGNINTTVGSINAAAELSTNTTLNLLTTSATAGQIKINSVTWLHAYGTSNVFVGPTAGNFTLSGATNNTGIGNRVLQFLTSGDYNAALGDSALFHVNSGIRNSGSGFNSLTTLTTGNRNCAFGANSLVNLITGSNNVGIGATSGADNGAGDAYTGAESNNICICSSGVLGESNKIRIGTQGSGAYQQDAAYIAGIYNTAVGATAGIVLSDSSHQLGGLAGAASTILVGGTKPSFTATPTCTDLTLTGVLKLPTTTSTVGQIQINSVASFHAYGTNSIFVGSNSGNFTFTTANAQYSTAVGVDSLKSISGTGANLGTQNTTTGYNGLGSCTDGSYNTGFGVNSGSSITTGSSNTFVGHNAGYSSATTGSHNTMIGAATGPTLATLDSSNILIGSGADAAAGTSNALVIGSGAGTGTGQLNKSWIHGIRGITTVNNDAIAVLIDSAGQLGTVSSSLKLKENIKDMGDRTSSIMSLRPVTFSYKSHINKSVPSYGLIAEEVAEVFPDLVVYDKENHPDTIKYHELPVMILNELQKLVKRVDELEKKLKDKGE